MLVRHATVEDDDPAVSAAASGGGRHAPRPAQGAAAWLPLPPVAAAPPGTASRAGWRPPPRLGAAGAPAAQVRHCSDYQESPCTLACTTYRRQPQSTPSGSGF